MEQPPNHSAHHCHRAKTKTDLKVLSRMPMKGASPVLNGGDKGNGIRRALSLPNRQGNVDATRRRGRVHRRSGGTGCAGERAYVYPLVRGYF